VVDACECRHEESQREAKDLARVRDEGDEVALVDAEGQVGLHADEERAEAPRDADRDGAYFLRRGVRWLRA